VRLPRDWLGPREELIPFGPRAASIEADQPPLSSEDPLPSPADFWGEQSAAIQSAVQAPSAPEGGIGGSRGAQPIRGGRLGRRAAGGLAAVLAIAAVAVGAVVSSAPGPRGTPHPADASNVGFAAVLSGGISSILRLDLGRVDAARVASTRVRRTPHRQSAPKRPHRTARRPREPVRIAPHVVAETTPAYRPVSTYTSDATNAGGTDTHSETRPATRPAPAQSPHRPGASRATVTATGESGALGPIQSPNG